MIDDGIWLDGIEFIKKAKIKFPQKEYYLLTSDSLNEKIQKAIEENIENAKNSGNKLTQTIDKQGNLIGIENMNTTETFIKSNIGENENIASADIHRELFEGDNIVIPSKDKNTKKVQ